MSLDHSEGCCCVNKQQSKLELYGSFGISLFLLILGLYLDKIGNYTFFTPTVAFIWYALAYLPVGLPVLKEAFKLAFKGEFFTEFLLMSIATLGAFYIEEYPEGVAVMLFYSLGELFQDAALKDANRNIKALLDIRPEKTNVWRNAQWKEILAEKVEINEKIQVKLGERIPLDGVLLSEKGSFNLSAITGESKPKSIKKTEKVLAGAINLEGLIEVEVRKKFENSSISRILEMVQNARSRKSKTELLIRKLAKIYTPIVTLFALLVVVIPYFVVDNYAFDQWLYRALVFLVISCPCALVISIPLGYFGGLGLASKHGILFKGASFLEDILAMKTLVMDKTGTITKGVFKVTKVEIKNNLPLLELMNDIKSIEQKSTHPIAKAILEYPQGKASDKLENVEEIPGKGIKAKIENKYYALGNKALMNELGIAIPKEVDAIVETIIMVAINQEFAAYLVIADELKSQVKESVQELRNKGVDKIVILSGDKKSITQKVASEIGVQEAKGDLLPEDKLNYLLKLKQQTKDKIAFVGDGINDAPVLAQSDIAIAMGAMGSDVAIETADIILQTDELSKIHTALEIAKATKQIIIQNISLAFGVKILVLILGLLDLTNLWMAVIADVGVALLAILNAMRLQKMKF